MEGRNNMILFTMMDVICGILLLLCFGAIPFLFVVNGILSIIEKVLKKHSNGDDDNVVK